MPLLIKQHKKDFNDPLHALCPYFAMFPPSFARDAIKKFTSPGDLVMDPFSGRGTTLLEARLLGRRVIANDINPVAELITSAKSKRISIIKCLSTIESLQAKFEKSNKFLLEFKKRSLPEFFSFAYNHNTLIQILWLRNKLKNAKTPEDIFIKTLAISYLHGETYKTRLTYFSNNLPHTYSPKPNYSINFWKRRNMKPPKVDIFEILKDRCIFRLKNSKQKHARYEGYSILGDVRHISESISRITGEKAKLIVTSPPYPGITSYETDQWLRLWFLGFSPKPTYGKFSRDDRIMSVDRYSIFLADSLREVRKVIDNSGYFLCRLGQSPKSNFSIKELLERSIYFGGDSFKVVSVEFSPFKKSRQARMFKSGILKKSGEYDFVLKPI